MDINNIISGINKASAIKRENERNKQNAEELRKAKYLEYIKSQSERIAKLLKVANALTENGYTLGEITKGHTNCPKYVSNGIYHKFGFIVRENPYWPPYICHAYGVGYTGGGWNGSDMVFDENGNNIKWNERVFCDGLTSFIDDLTSFENRFYQYVETIINK